MSSMIVGKKAGSAAKAVYRDIGQYRIILWPGGQSGSPTFKQKTMAALK